MVALYVFIQTALMGRFENKSKGATAVEYGIMVAAIAVAILATVFLLGDKVAALFATITAKLP
ncbi:MULTISPECIES: Flp family type IVb pilin [Aestuariimicrobium]|jgi:pilus assembly protein Flp/PilA|uniref:Flp family type IVb pilin n=1 Tax=Aestuariimicrobium TaxID=396388 RepID=UPI0003B42FF2|nr:MULTISPECIES: Flp family type IVb pilin [Aestuariimicrobium]CAI9406831.1 hypothetical protein AESSP_01702 [Aestuariimicrobium sp. T2.26MG-19.2B]